MTCVSLGRSSGLKEISDEENHSAEALGQESSSDASSGRAFRRKAAPRGHYPDDHLVPANRASLDWGVLLFSAAWNPLEALTKSHFTAENAKVAEKILSDKHSSLRPQRSPRFILLGALNQVSVTSRRGVNSYSL